jgi:DNA-binding response OmpR family regulator
MRVLLVERKPKARRIALERAGYQVQTAENGKDADRKAKVGKYDVIVLDLGTPDVAGASYVRKWRNDGVRAHIVVLTADDTLPEKVNFFSAGADDCMSKACEGDELLAQLRALARRDAEPKTETVVVFDLEVNRTERIARRAGKLIPLTAREFDLLQFLVANRGKPVSRAMIRDHLYEDHEKGKSNVIDVYVRYLRKKIDAGFDYPLIVTCWGKGYMVRTELEADQAG